MMEDTTTPRTRRKGSKSPRQTPPSVEARASGLVKIQEARKARQEWGRANLRRDFLDADHWAELAHYYGIRLPQWWVACTPAHMIRWLHKLGFSMAWYRDWAGESDLGLFAERNPDWPLRAFVGLLLEERESGGH